MKSRLIGPPGAPAPLRDCASAMSAAPVAARLAEVVKGAVGPRSIPELKRRVVSLHASLAAAPSLAPSPRVNALFGELVALTNAADGATSRALLADSDVTAIVPALRVICARGEAELEAHWAKRITASSNPSRELRNFPYFGNYEKLARLEAHALRGVTTQPLERALFIGSGPLPLSSMLFSASYGMQVDNLDIDAAAVRMGSEVARSVGMADRQRFFHGDITSYAKADLWKADVVCVAALAGLDPQQKAAIVAVLAEGMRPESVLMVRSADRLRRLLYPAIEPEDVHGFEPQSLVHPLNDVVNSVVVFKKPLA